MFCFESILANLMWRPVSNPALIVLLALFLGSASVASYVRAGGGWLLSMRLVATAFLAFLMFGLSHVPPFSNTTTRSDLYVLLDVSESMLTEDVDGEERLRCLMANWLRPEQIRQLSEAFDVHLFSFASDARRLSWSSLNHDEIVRREEITKLVDSICDTMRNEQMYAIETQNMLVLSDGIDSAESSMSRAISQAKTRDVLIHTVRIGGETGSVDATLVAVPLQDYLMPNEPGGIHVKVYQVGLDQATTVLRLKKGTEERTFPIAFAGRSAVEIQVPIQESESGQYEYELELDPITGERLTSNNSQIVFSLVQERRIRVLLIEGQPFWDTKFLAQSLRKDDRIQLTQVSQVTPRKRETIVTRQEGQTDSRVPTNLQEWADYDLIILGKGIENVLSQKAAESLVEYVRDHGGHLVFARALSYDRETARGREMSDIIGPIEPVVFGDGVWADMKLSLTASGRTAHWFAPTKMGLNVKLALDRLPGFNRAPVVIRAKAGAIVLADAVPTSGGPEQAKSLQPALATMSFGGGSVVAVLGEGAWKWSLLAPENKELFGFYDAFWSNMIRWQVVGGDFQPGQQVSMRLSGSSARVGDTVDVDVLLKHDPPSGIDPTLSLTDPVGDTLVLPLSSIVSRQPRFSAKFVIKRPGTYSLKLNSPGMIPAEVEEKLSAYELNMERLDTAARPMALRMLAENTGGRMFEPEEFDEFVSHLQRQTIADQIPPVASYLWDRWWVMVALVGWLGAEWLLRRRMGLI